jgi:hypothetical protein
MSRRADRSNQLVRPTVDLEPGLVPVKLFDFDEVVNVTLGLPICAPHPDHDVAYDIADLFCCGAGDRGVRDTTLVAA